jgi:hypothetical protein
VSLDPKIIEAIKCAVVEHGQPPALAQRLVAWLEGVADDSEDINDMAATDRHLEVIYDAVQLGSIPESKEIEGNRPEEDD